MTKNSREWRLFLAGMAFRQMSTVFTLSDIRKLYKEFKNSGKYIKKDKVEVLVGEIVVESIIKYGEYTYKSEPYKINLRG